MAATGKVSDTSGSKPVPWRAEGRSAVTPYLVCENAMDVVAFAQKVFDATLIRKPLMRADGTLWNAELQIDDTSIMVSDMQGDFRFNGFVYVMTPDVDATYQKAIDAGATAFMPPQDQFYGDRDGGVMDQSGNLWWIGTHQKKLTDAEIENNARAF